MRVESYVQSDIALPPLPSLRPRAQKHKNDVSRVRCLGMWIVQEGPRYGTGPTYSFASEPPELSLRSVEPWCWVYWEVLSVPLMCKIK